MNHKKEHAGRETCVLFLISQHFGFPTSVNRRGVINTLGMVF